MNKLTMKTRSEDEDDELSDGEKFRYYKQALPSYKLVADFTKPILERNHYFELLEDMEQLTEDDVAIFKIDNGGGSLGGAIAVINGIHECEAPVIGELCGHAASAATLILLSCDYIKVKPYSTMMIHGAAFGSGGHQTNVVAHAIFIDAHARDILSAVYKDFLTDEEFSDVLKGLEVYFNYDQILERLEKRDKIREQRFKEQHPEMDFEDDEE